MRDNFIIVTIKIIDNMCKENRESISYLADVQRYVVLNERI